MQTVLIVVHLLIVLALIGVVLLQRSEGGLGLGSGSSGGGGFMSGRGQANALTRATAILAAMFFLTSLVLGIVAHRGHAPRSIFDQNAPTGAPADSQPAGSRGPGVLEELQRMQQPATPISPSVPSQPQTPQAPQSR